MDNTEFGHKLQIIRKKELGMTQLQVTEATQLEIKKISRIESGYQLPDEEYFKSLEYLGFDTKEIRQIRDDLKRRQFILRKQNSSEESTTLAKDIAQLKIIVAKNNLILKDLSKTQIEIRHLLKNNKDDGFDNLINEALS
tara:strand:+ start:297 stop:716 length:420 start_codon:yes stop_codon:yes gene_type:complete